LDVVGDEECGVGKKACPVVADVVDDDPDPLLMATRSRTMMASADGFDFIKESKSFLRVASIASRDCGRRDCSDGIVIFQGAKKGT
jgi:hypothetical protein